LIEYKQNASSVEQLTLHFLRVDHLYQPPLSSRLNIKDYATKLENSAATFEAWDDGQLVGLVAVYLNQPPKGYVTDVSVEGCYAGQGIAKKLLKQCIANAQAEKCFDSLELKVSQDNQVAINLYHNLGFSTIESEAQELVMQLNLRSGE
jgi:ribosomal protein S18 acetylase RimI-like enzyme